MRQGGTGHDVLDAGPRRRAPRRLRIAREGLPFVLVPLAASALSFAAGWPVAGVVLALAATASAGFFRDPDRVAPDDAALVLAPADGRVTAVEETADGLHVAIFLSVFDVHVNRAPVAGTVTSSRHTRGRFLAAFRPEAADVNERHDVCLDTPRGDVRVAQIAGLIARRIVCRIAAGDRVARGERFGLIRFGSRTDVVLPAGAAPLVRPGDRVRGGETPVARWRDEGAA